MRGSAVGGGQNPGEEYEVILTGVDAAAKDVCWYRILCGKEV
jgi:hypothetical protein